MHLRFCFATLFVAILSLPVLSQYSIPPNITGSIYIDEVDQPYQVPAGQTIHIEDGGLLNVGAGVTIRMGPGSGFLVEGRIEVDGTSVAKVRIEDSSGSAWGQIRLSNADGLSFFDDMILEGAGSSYAIHGVNSDFNITESTIRQNQGGGVYAEGSGGTVKVMTSVLSEMNGQFIHLRSVSNALIHGNVIQNSLNTYDDLIDVESSSGITIENNFIASGGDECLDADNSSSLVILGNTMTDCSDHLMTLKDVEDTIIERNVMTDSRVGSYCFDGSSITFERNTFYDLDTGVGCDGGSSASVRNSIFDEIGGLGGNVSVSHSMSDSDNIGGGTGNFVAEPEMIDPEEGDFRLTEGSPARGAASDGSDLGAMQYETVSLPIELASFVATGMDEAVLITWQTASETNNAGFEILHEQRDRTFRSLGFIPGAGTTEEARDYSFTVLNLVPGTTRFRLRQIDTDGTNWYSAIVSATVGFEGGLALLNVYPNPGQSSTTINIAAQEDKDVRIAIVDMLGREVVRPWRGRVSAGESHSIQVMLDWMPPGTFVVTATDETNSVIATKSLTIVK